MNTLLDEHVTMNTLTDQYSIKYLSCINIILIKCPCLFLFRIHEQRHGMLTFNGNE